MSVAASEFATGRQKLLGHLAGLLFAILIAGSFSVGKLASPHIEPAAINGIRFILATCLIGLIVLATTRGPILRPVTVWRYGIIGFLMATYFILMFVALKITDPVPTGAVFTLVPLMSAGFGWLVLRQTTAPVVLASLIIAAVGAIWVIFRGDIDAILGLEIGRGEAIFFVGCAAHALYPPLVRLFNRGEPVLQFSFYTLIAATLWICGIGVGQIATTPWLSLPPIVWIAVGYLAVFTTAGTFFLVQYASLRLPASKVLAYSYLTPAFVILIEGIIGHGWVSLSIVAGAVLTAAALFVMAFAPDK